MSTEELREEQQFVSGLYARLDALREEAESAVRASLSQVGNGLQARLERDVLVAERSGLLAAFDAGENGLCFGRLEFRDGRRGLFSEQHSKSDHVLERSLSCLFEFDQLSQDLPV